MDHETMGIINTSLVMISDIAIKCTVSERYRCRSRFPNKIITYQYQYCDKIRMPVLIILIW